MLGNCNSNEATALNTLATVGSV